MNRIASVFAATFTGEFAGVSEQHDRAADPSTAAANGGAYQRERSKQLHPESGAAHTFSHSAAATTTAATAAATTTVR